VDVGVCVSLSVQVCLSLIYIHTQPHPVHHMFKFFLLEMKELWQRNSCIDEIQKRAEQQKIRSRCCCRRYYPYIRELFQDVNTGTVREMFAHYRNLKISTIWRCEAEILRFYSKFVKMVMEFGHHALSLLQILLTILSAIIAIIEHTLEISDWKEKEYNSNRSNNSHQYHKNINR
jgi:hypothetical protein